ncbi:MAG TPA: enoyl-[acyl-carrier-protein] reductase FabK [Candidatus Spyradocola merdavium]|nr:enoyl-[acyl-carrier-protein] reductase FabK [Candidatus Spyradocola merdavium]
MIHTEICDLLGIEYPIFQGGMAWVSDASLAGAVSNAGGLGIIAGMNSNGEQLREQIRKIREITNKPYGVNVMLMSPYADEVAQVVVEEKVPVVVTGAGLPSKYIKTWVENGLKVVPVVPSVAIARMCERMGACAVVAEGGESGGHVGDLTTMALTPQVVDAVKIPVLAAGGIGDGRGVAAALMLGAKGVQVGTRFLVATECTIHENYKQRVLKAKDIDTIVTGRRLGHPVRGLKSPVTRRMQDLEYSADFTAEEFEKMGVGAMRKAAREGDEQNGSFMCGQIAGLVNKEQPAAEIIREMFDQAEELLKGAAQWVR